MVTPAKLKPTAGNGSGDTMPYLSRPYLQERPNYEPACPQEEFIVPLLRHEIESALAILARPAPEHGRALDVGCGRQPFRKSLEAGGYTYFSLDAQQNIVSTVDVVGAIDAPLTPELVDHGPFDFILCTEVLEHVADWDMAFRNLAALLRSGGRVLITCPHFYQLHEEPYDFWRPTLHSLQFFAWRVGLQTIQLKAAGDAWDVLGTVLANCQPSATSRRLRDRGVSKLVRLSQGILFKLLASRRLQEMVRMDGPLYQSNVVVFQKGQ
jgi:SAM-dependent methyltransferase